MCWCGGTQWQGREAMRISVSSYATTEADVEASLASILACAAAAAGGPAMTAAVATAAGLTGRGFARLPAAEVRAWLGAARARPAGPASPRSWNDLDTDEYMADGGRYRRRRYACFAVDGAAIARQPHRPHYQSRGYNALNGGIDRWFTPVDRRSARTRC